MGNKTCLWCKYVNPLNGKCIILGKKVPETVTGCPVKEAREKIKEAREKKDEQ